jgi:LysR family hydrogen peroxide-inducible transcriptional activator
MEEEVLLAVPKSMPLTAEVRRRPDGLPWLSLSDLKSCPFLLHDPSNRLRDFSNELFRSVGFQPARYYEFKSTLLLSRLASAGMGIIFLPETFIEPEAALDYYSIGPEGCFRPLALGYPAGYRSNSLKIFSEMLRNALYEKQRLFRQSFSAAAEPREP